MSSTELSVSCTKLSVRRPSLTADPMADTTAVQPARAVAAMQTAISAAVWMAVQKARSMPGSRMLTYKALERSSCTGVAFLHITIRNNT